MLATRGAKTEIPVYVSLLVCTTCGMVMGVQKSIARRIR